MGWNQRFRDQLQYLELTKDVIKAKDYEASKEKWLKEKAESNQKAQEELKTTLKSRNKYLII